MASFTEYVQRVRLLVGDANYSLFNPTDVALFINEARRQVAMEGEVLRCLPQDLYTVEGQEIYPFSAVDLTPFPGYSYVYQVKSIALIWGSFQYVVERVSFSKYQAVVRNYTQGFQYIPCVGAQFGDGQNAVMYLYPIANDVYQMFWDCYCAPIDLSGASGEVEAIPSPWTDAIPFYAAYQLLNTMQVSPAGLNENLARIKQADRMFGEYMKFMLRARQFASRGQINNPYGRS
ncbi:MAG TPA: hypothetical protein VMT20_15290 [Terriglobia bacterium]|nr:hypothetical protein [Terriglobia bacterium]